jgi:hypothetical protein
VIVMRRFTRRSIHVEFDEDGARDLASALIVDEKREAHVFVEKNLLPGRAARRQGIVSLRLVVSRRPEKEREDTIRFRREDVTLRLDADAIEYILDRLGRCKDEGFAPAEMCEALVSGDATVVTLYGEYKQNLALPSADTDTRQ